MPAITAVVLGGANILWRLRVDYGVRVGGAAGGIFYSRGYRWPECRIKFPAHCPVRFSLLLSLVVPSVCIVTKSLNGTHAVAMRIRHDFLLKFMEKKMARHSIKMIALLTAFGLASAAMTGAGSLSGLLLFPNWLAWAFLPVAAMARRKREKRWALT